MSGVTRRQPLPYVPAGPIDRPPAGFRPAERRPAMRHVLRGVQLGTWDQRLIDWLLDWDDTTVRTVASLIERARSAGAAQHRELILAALGDAAAYREERGAAECGRCDDHPAGVCDDHGDDLARAAGYRALTRELGADG